VLPARVKPGPRGLELNPGGPTVGMESLVGPSIRVGVVFALSIEAGCFVDTLGDVRVTRGDGFVVRQGGLGGRDVVLVESGAGGEHATTATHAMIDAYQPRLVVSAGFAGGLVPYARRQDLILATELRNSVGQEIALDPKAHVSWLGDVPRCHLGRLLTLDRVVRLREEKEELGRRYEALAVDMESFAVAEICRTRDVEFLAVRAVSDALEDELPPDIAKLLTQRSFAGQLGAAVGSVFRRFSAVKDLFNLHQNALASSNRLASFLGMLVQ
jgi:adenosylhomocysteine nucleosidase